MSNINAFQLVVHEKKIFLILIKIIFLILPLFGPQMGPAPLFEQSESPFPRHHFYQVWLKLAW